MAGAGTIIAGILAGGAAFGGALLAVDPLGARRAPPPPLEVTDEHIEAWSTGTFPTREGARAALEMFGYSGQEAASEFQIDTNEIRAWLRAAVAGEERLPPPGSGFVQIPVALQGMMSDAGPDLAQSGELDQTTVEALGQAVRAVVFSTGATCMTEGGQVVEANVSSCRDAWQQAFRFAYEANLAAHGHEPEASSGPGPGLGQSGPPPFGFRT